MQRTRRLFDHKRQPSKAGRWWQIDAKYNQEYNRKDDMGTNFYVTPPPCPHCGRTGERLHIGKSSAGWCFALATHPDLSINTLDDWKAHWADKAIVDEYGNSLTIDEMLDRITNRSWGAQRETPFGYSSWRAFHEVNHSEPGPNNLLRHRVDGRFCTGHGEGTWDYMKGEFS